MLQQISNKIFLTSHVQTSPLRNPHFHALTASCSPPRARLYLASSHLGSVGVGGNESEKKLELNNGLKKISWFYAGVKTSKLSHNLSKFTSWLLHYV